MATVKLAYGTSTALTCVLANLSTGTAGTGITSDAQNNSGGVYLDAMVTVQVCLLTGGTTGNSNNVQVYFFGSEDGQRYSDDISSGTAGSFVLKSPTTLLGPVSIGFPAATGAPRNIAFIGSVASYFDGTLPRQWGICVKNDTNTPLNTGTLMTASWTPVYLTVA